MEIKKNPFAGSVGIIVVGAAIGVMAAALQKWGNPANMGVCVACFARDISGALGLHRADVVQYLRPEIPGFILGAFAAAFLFGEFKPRGGSAPLARFVLGMCAMIGALVFLGCPWRAGLRLAGGDFNALFGIAGLAVGIGVGVLFFRSGFSFGRSGRQSTGFGLIFPLIALGFLALLFLYPQKAGEPKTDILFYSVKGPGSMHAPLFISLGIGLIIGFIAQRSRFCTMGAFRDLILFRHFHLFSGFVALIVAAAIADVVLGQFKPGFADQPIAHTQSFWNFAGMITAGLAFALAGGCPGRQLFMSGEGDGDAGIFALGMLTGAAVAHNFGLASSPAGIGPHGMAGLATAFIACVFIGYSYTNSIGIKETAHVDDNRRKRAVVSSTGADGARENAGNEDRRAGSGG